MQSAQQPATSLPEAEADLHCTQDPAHHPALTKDFGLCWSSRSDHHHSGGATAGATGSTGTQVQTGQQYIVIRFRAHDSVNINY